MKTNCDSTSSASERLALHAANPLLEPLGPYVETRQDWIKILAYDPLKGLDRRSLAGEQRIRLLEDLQHKFEPVLMALDTVADAQDMMRSCLRALNPLLAEARISQNALLATTNRAARLDDIPWFGTPINGKLLYGVTGLGKTHPFARLIDLLPRVHIHAGKSIPGWMKCTQIVSLYVKMPTDGYRSGFLQSILLEVDRLCGSTYSTQYRNERVDTLAVRVCHILVSHCLAMLVVDDINVRNFALSPERDAVLLLFLKMLDFGIPVALIANPLALVDIESFSQDNRRLTTNEPQEYMPYEFADKEWAEGLVPSAWRHSVMEVPTPFSKEIKQILDNASAGFPHYLTTVVVGVQKYAIRRGAKQVTTELLQEYVAQSKTLASARSLLQGFREKDARMLSEIEDVPWQEYGVRWGTLDTREILDNKGGDMVSKSGRKAKATRESRLQSLQQRAARRYLAERAKKDQREKANKAASSECSPEDMRGGGLTGLHVGALRGLRDEAETSKRRQ